jgi:hypothetical protein
MADIPQVLATYDALVGVALGAGLTYGFGALNRRHQEAQGSGVLSKCPFMRAAPEEDSEGGQGPGRVAGVVAERGGEFARPRLAQHLDDSVAQGRHDVGAANTQLGRPR